MGPKRRKSQAKKTNVTAGDGRPKCCFCKQPGLLPEEEPLSDEDRKDLQERKRQGDHSRDHLSKFPISYEIEFERKYGGWIDDKNKTEKDNLSCHTSCLTNSPSLFESEEDFDETFGGLGFNRKQIRDEVNRASKLACHFCKLKGANVGCVVSSCRMMYHFSCGVENNFIFVSDNKSNPSFCTKHMTKEFRSHISKGQPKYCLDIRFDVKAGKPVQLSEKQEYYATEKKGNRRLVKCKDFPTLQKIEKLADRIRSVSENEAAKIESELSQDDTDLVTCKICSEIFDNLANIVFGRCCNFAIFHRSCMTKVALNSGMHHFKCPLCGDSNKELFLKNSVAQGVSCPNRDASWELNNEFEDQLSDYRKDEGCQMRNCKHKGKPNEDGTIFEIILCDQCGGHGSHIACDQKLMELFDKKTRMDWDCPVCSSIIHDENSVAYESENSISSTINVSNLTLVAAAEPEKLMDPLEDEKSETESNQNKSDHESEQELLESEPEEVESEPEVVESEPEVAESEPEIEQNEPKVKNNEPKVEENEHDLGHDETSSDSKKSDIENDPNIATVDLTVSDDSSGPLSERQNKSTFVSGNPKKRKISSQDSEFKKSPKKPRKGSKSSPVKQSNLITNYFNKSPSKK